MYYIQNEDYFILYFYLYRTCKHCVFNKSVHMKYSNIILYKFMLFHIFGADLLKLNHYMHKYSFNHSFILLLG